MSDIQSVMYSQTALLESGEHSFVFMLPKFASMVHGKKVDLYGVCVLNPELLVVSVTRADNSLCA
jgi:hypothetical protein